MFYSPEDATSKRIIDIEKKMMELRKERTELRRTREPRPMSAYAFVGSDGAEVTLAKLFGVKERLIVIHNMGFSCQYCTMWADGFNSLVDTVQKEADAAFAIVSPDTPEQQAKGAAARGWSATMVQDASGSFTTDLGFKGTYGGEPSLMPGTSTFIKQPDGGVALLNQTAFGPGDEFNHVYQFADLLPAKAAS